jgi:hypothetical protein
MNINDVVKISSNEQYTNTMFRIIKVSNKTVTVRELPDAQLHAYTVRVNKDNVTVIWALSNEQYEQYRQIQRDKYIANLAELRPLISEADYNMRKERYDAYYL